MYFFLHFFGLVNCFDESNNAYSNFPVKLTLSITLNRVINVTSPSIMKWP